MLFMTQFVIAQEIEGPLTVCDGDCEEYTYYSDQLGTYIWSVLGGVMENNRGNKVTICWEEAQIGEISIINTSVSTSAPEITIQVEVSSKPDTDVVFPLIPLCQAKDSMQIEPNGEFPEPDCKLVCPGSLATYSVGSIDDVFSTWQVEGGSLIDKDSVNTAQVKWDDEGLGSLLVVSQNQAGCIDSNYYCIEIMDKPQVDISVINSSADLNGLCLGQEIQLSATSDIAVSYEWQTSDGQTALTSSPTFGFDQEGQYDIKLITTTECNCTDTTSLQVKVLAPVSPIIDCVGATCVGEEKTYYAADICGNYTWEISGEGTIIDGGTSGDDFVTVIWNDGPLGSVTLTTGNCVDNNICTAPIEVVIPILGTSLDINGLDSPCTNNSTTYSVPFFPGATYNWTVTGNGFISNGYGTNEISVSWNQEPWADPNSQIDVTVSHCILECGSSGSKAVIVKHPFHISANQTACLGSTKTIYAVTGFDQIPVDWTMETPDGTQSSVGNNVDNIRLALDQGPGIYKFKATENSGIYCNSEAATYIKVVTGPAAPDNIEGAVEICKGEAYPYTFPDGYSGYSYTWRVKDGTSNSRLYGEEVLVTWSSDGPYSLTLTAKDLETGCESDEVSLSVISAAGGTLMGNTLSCLDDKSVYSITDVLPGKVEWDISPTDAGSIGLLDDGNVEIHWHLSGTHTINAFYCGQNYALSVEVLAPPSFTIDAPASVCVGDKATVTFSGPAGATYKVFDEKERFLSGDNPALVPGGHLGVEITDANGCNHRESFYIEPYEQPEVHMSSRDWGALCTPGATATIETVVTNNGLSYQWFKNGVAIGSDSPKLEADEAAEYEVIVTDVRGCTNSDKIYLECREGGGICDCRSDGGTRFSATQGSYCNEFQFTNTSFDFIAGTLSYNFDDPDSGSDNTTTDENPTHIFSKAGHYNVRLSGSVPSTNVPGETCLASYTATVTVEAVADFDQTTACAGEVISFEELSNFLEGNSIAAYAWDFGDPTSGVDNTSDLEEPDHVFALPGIYLVSLTITTDSGCMSTITKAIDVKGLPTLDFKLPDSQCSEIGLTFQVTTPAIFDLVWDFGDPASGAANTSGNQSPIHEFSAPGNYTVTLSGKNIFGCDESVTKSIDIADQSLAGNISADKPMPMCEGETTILAAPTGGIGYLWSNGETTDQISVTEPGIYTVTVTSADVCDFTPDPFVVSTIQPIDPIIRAYVGDEFRGRRDKLDICLREYFTLSIGYFNNATISWSVGGSTSWRLEYSDLRSLTPGKYEITVDVTDNDTGCTITSAPFELTINELPAAPSISSDLSDMCEGPEFTFSVDTPDPNLRYFWSNGQEGTSIKATKPGSYNVTAVNQHGCTSSSNYLRIDALPDVSGFLTGCLEVCFPQELCLSNINNVASVQWLLDGTPIPAPEGTARTLEATGIGEYQAILTSFAGCTNTTDILSLTPETNQQTLTGTVFIDENGNGIQDAGEILLSDIPVRVVSGITIIQETTTDANGVYLLDPLQTSEAVIQLDTTAIGFAVSDLEFEYAFVLTECIEDLTQDFPLTKACLTTSSNLIEFTCAGESTMVMGQSYEALDKDTIYLVNKEGCDSLVYLEVMAYDVPLVNLMITNSCLDTPTGRMEISIVNGTGLTYDVDGTGSFSAELSHYDLSEGPHVVYVKDSNGCISEEAFDIGSMPALDVVFAPANITCEAQTSTLGLTIVDGGNDITYLWSDGSSATDLTVNEDGDYTVEVSDGCSTLSHTWNVDNLDNSVSSDVYVPSIFSTQKQDIDGGFKAFTNDELAISKFHMDVMDKWGMVIFSTDDPQESWNGKIKNKNAQTGVYTWMYEIEYESCNQTETSRALGSVTLLR